MFDFVERVNFLKVLLAISTFALLDAPARALSVLAFPTANDLAGPVFVQPFAGLQITSVSAGIGTTEPFFSDLPDGVFPNNKVVNLAGNFQAFDEFGSPSAFDIVGVEVSNDLSTFFIPAFGQFNFAGTSSVTFTDAFSATQVTFFAADPTLAFIFIGNPNLAYEYRLLITGLAVGSFVIFDDVETSVRVVAEPPSGWLIAIGAMGLMAIRVRRPLSRARRR